MKHQTFCPSLPCEPVGGRAHVPFHVYKFIQYYKSCLNANNVVFLRKYECAMGVNVQWVFMLNGFSICNGYLCAIGIDVQWVLLCIGY